MNAPALLAANEAEFDFEVGPHGAGALSVLRFEVAEALSTPFTAEVELVPGPDVEVEEAKLLGQDALLSVHLGTGEDRLVHGVVAQARRWSVGSGPESRRLKLRVVPRLWMLGHMRRSRIFQGLTVPQIVSRILKAGQVELREALTGSYSARDFCVQYCESDLAFISRLLEEEGIFYFFEHQPGAHTLVLGDSPSAHAPLPGASRIVFREPNRMLAAEDYIDSFGAVVEVQPGAVVLRDFNFLQPAQPVSGQAEAADGDAALEVYEYPARFDQASVGKQRSKVRLEEFRARAATASGEGVSRRLVPGFLFELDEHPDASLNGEYLILSTQQVGSQREVLAGTQVAAEREGYRSQFTCLRSDVPFRPERRQSRPTIPGAQTATVVGPPGEEIHTDEHGRIKVQFHWDREGKGDDKSSCWIRVSQSWAGAGFGALYLPRIGQEVVVEFLEGDPDQPIVTGSVYNGHHPPPISLPGDKTQSTLRSSSSPGGDGFNELRFEDAAGSEQVFLHAQKDLEIVVLNDKTQKVGGQETLQVTKDRSREIKGSQSLSVGGDESATIGGNQSLDVTKDRSVTVGGNHTESIGGSQSVTVGGAQTTLVALASTETIGAAKALTIGGAYAVTVAGAMNEAVGGLKSELVGGAKVELVGAKKTETVRGDKTLEVKGALSETVGKTRNLKVEKDLLTNVGGKFDVAAKETYAIGSKDLVLAAEESFTLTVGSATIQVKKGGEVLIKGAKIEITASGEVILKGSKVQEN